MEVLLAGNTGYVTETFIEESFPECDVVVLGNEMLKSNRKKNILSRPFIKDEKELKEIFETYEFERIVYFVCGGQDFVRRAANRRAAAHGAGVGGDDGCKPGCSE